MATNSPAPQPAKRTVKDFKFIKEIGTGAYSTVYLVNEIAADRELALKAISKMLIKRLNKTSEVFRERGILASLSDCPYTVRLYCTFQDDKNLYFGLTYCSSGDLLQYINDAGHFEPETVRFYAAELVEALEHLHTRRIVHRDLKPENILLSDDMHVQLADFGSAITLDSHGAVEQDKPANERRNSLVGTAQFVAPEILERELVHIGSDFWSLGCIIYQMATGKHLFRGGHEYEIMNAVVRVSYKLPDDFPEAIGDLIGQLLRRNPSERLGSEETGGIAQLKAHAFFDGTKWGELLTQHSPLPAKFNSRTDDTLCCVGNSIESTTVH